MYSFFAKLSQLQTQLIMHNNVAYLPLVCCDAGLDKLSMVTRRSNKHFRIQNF